MRRLIQFLMYSLLLASAVASADDLSRKQRKLLEETQIAYGATIRWGSMDDAIGYLDPKLRKDYGVYYTPREVVELQVRLASELLEKRFGKKLGFADDGVVFLDPAVGTGTYLCG